MDAAIDHRLRDTWQGRALAETRYEPLGMVVLSVLAHSFDEVLPDLLRATFPDFVGISTPFICSAAKIDKRGRIVADVVWEDYCFPSSNEPIFRDLRHLEREFRRLADRLKLSDVDRILLMAAAKKWVVADRRLDPNMDPRDPDARRLVVH